MALKRSGVRASFAPSYHHFSPFSGRVLPAPASRPGCSIRLWFLQFVCLFCALAVGNLGADAQQSPPQASAKTRTDVFLFIRPDSPSTARIGLAYSKRVSHAQVEREVKKLLVVSGWKLKGEIRITDKTVHPEDPRHFPPTTGAAFSLTDAPQFHDNAPMLIPYLKAFQAWNRLEILFVTSDLQPYNGVTDFHTPALDIKLEKSEGIYSYLVTLRDHSGELPPLIADIPDVVSESTGKTLPAPKQQPRPTETGSDQSSRSLFWPYLFIIAGSLLAGGVALFLFAKRHQENLKPGRPR